MDVDLHVGINLKQSFPLHTLYMRFRIYEGRPKMPYNCIISLNSKSSITLIHMHPVGNLFLDILLKLHKISYSNRQII